MLAVQLEWKLSFWNGEYVFTSSCGLCCLWKLKCGGLLTCGDLSLAFFGLVLYFTEKLYSIVEIVAERLSWTWSGS